MPQRIMVDLDSLLDTRLGTMAKEFPNWPKKVMGYQNGWYWKRRVDNFDQILGQGMSFAFASAYKNRDLLTLSKSFETNIIEELRRLLLGTDVLSEADPQVDGNDLIINFWPYDFGNNESADNFLRLIKGRIAPLDDRGEPTLDFKIERAYYAPEELTLEKIEELSEIIIMYDFRGWHDAHASSLEEQKHCPRNTLIAPAFFYGDKEQSRDAFRLPDGTTVDPWEWASRHYARYIRLTFWRPFTFSILSASHQ